jgi:hypothetical protein
MVTILGATLAWAEPALGVPLEVEVRAPDGALVRTAVVRFPGERVPHRVHTETGRMVSSCLYFDDGSELIFERGMQLGLEVVAPGYEVQPARATLRGRRTRVVVTLRSLDPAPSPGAPDAEENTLGALAAWQQAEVARLAGEAGALAAIGRARSHTAQHAERWLEWLRATGGEDPRALEICRTASDHPERCEI